MRIERAVREKTFTLTSIAGPSGSGKTYSAILYARGLVGPDGKVGFIDTENKRSRFYADVGGGFDVIDLDPPFTSARYVEAINEFQDAGYTAIVIDSISHEWEGTGGVLEQAEAIEEATKKSGLHCWKKPKAAHKRLMNELLQTKAHLIFCCRVKEKVEQVKNGGRTEIVNQGFVVVQEKSFIYEMTVSMMLEEGTHVPVMQKCPDDLLNVFPGGQKISIKHGDGVRMWSDRGTVVDPAFKALRLAGLDAANKGTTELSAWWESIGPERRKEFASLKDTFKSIATARDQIAADIAEADGPSFEDRFAAARQRPASAPEGFDPSHVARETQSLSAGQEIDQEPASDHPPSKSETAGSASDNPTSPGHSDDATEPAEPVEAGAEGQEQSEPAPASDDFTADEWKWLRQSTRMIWAATEKGYQETVDNQVIAIKEATPAEIGKAARDKLGAIRKQCKLVCFGELEHAEGRKIVAALSGVSEEELREVEP